MASEEPKKTRGRQKIEMKRIESEDDRQTAFSKRRSGVFKKASELVTMTGAEVAVVVFSPAGKPFSFGHPSVEQVADRFLGQEPQPPNDVVAKSHQLVEAAQREVIINELNQQHNEALGKLEEEKGKEKELKQKMKGMEMKKGWWNAPIEEMDMENLLQTEAAFMEFHGKLIDNIKGKTNRAASSSSFQSLQNPSVDLSAQIADNNPFMGSNADENNPHGTGGFDYHGRKQF